MKEIIAVITVAVLSVAVSSALSLVINGDMLSLKQLETQYLKQIGITPHENPNSLASRN